MPLRRVGTVFGWFFDVRRQANSISISLMNLHRLSTQMIVSGSKTGDFHTTFQASQHSLICSTFPTDKELNSKSVLNPHLARTSVKH